MWTERDQIQAYQFLRRRLVSALTVADANHPVALAVKMLRRFRSDQTATSCDEYGFHGGWRAGIV